MVRQRIIRTVWKPICAACALPVLTFCQKDPWVGADMGLDGSVPAEETYSSDQDAGVTRGTSSQASNTTSHATNDQSDTTRSTSVADDDVTGDTSVTTQSTTTHVTTSGNEGTTPNTLDTTAPNTTAASTESAITTTASSTQTNTNDAGDDTSEEPVVDVPEGVPGIIGVGYGGIRIVSRDNGLTWSDQSHWKGPYSEGEDKDDTYLLRSVAYGNGVWVAAGWQLVTSTDGVNWSEPQSTRDVLGQNDCGITDGMAFGKGQFLAACGSSINRSTDGRAWKKPATCPTLVGILTSFSMPRRNNSR